MMKLSKILHKLQSMRYYVIADPSDNSVTLSKRLFYHMKKHQESTDVSGASVFVFRIPSHNTFGFMLGHGIEEPAQLCQIQYNGKYRCIGFETLCPSVGRIFFEYGLPALRPVKLSVSVRRTKQGKEYYQIDAPTPKMIRQCKAYSETHAGRI